MNLETKLNEYKSNIEELKAVESLEVYRWLMSLGEKLNDDPLSEEKRVEKIPRKPRIQILRLLGMKLKVNLD